MNKFLKSFFKQHLNLLLGIYFLLYLVFSDKILSDIHWQIIIVEQLQLSFLFYQITILISISRHLYFKLFGSYQKKRYLPFSSCIYLFFIFFSDLFFKGINTSQYNISICITKIISLYGTIIIIDWNAPFYQNISPLYLCSGTYLRYSGSCHNTDNCTVLVSDKVHSCFYLRLLCFSFFCNNQVIFLNLYQKSGSVYLRGGPCHYIKMGSDGLLKLFNINIFLFHSRLNFIFLQEILKHIGRHIIVSIDFNCPDKARHPYPKAKASEKSQQKDFSFPCAHRKKG